MEGLASITSHQTESGGSILHWAGKERISFCLQSFSSLLSTAHGTTPADPPFCLQLLLQENSHMHLMTGAISKRNTFYTVPHSIPLLNSHKKLQVLDIHVLLEKH